MLDVYKRQQQHAAQHRAGDGTDAAEHRRHKSLDAGHCARRWHQRGIGRTQPVSYTHLYPTCREKAIAVYQGKADLSMCLPFLKEKAETFSGYVINNTPNAIFVLDENLCEMCIRDRSCALPPFFESVRFIR